MVRKFRETHLFSFLRRFDARSQPLDRALSDYLKAHKSIGAHDRRDLSECVYSLMRWKGLLDHLLDQESAWEDRYALWRNLDMSRLPPRLPLWVRCGASRWLFQELAVAYGDEKAACLCRILNDPAPLTIRANLLKTTREHLLALWEKIYPVEPCLSSASGICFQRRLALTSFPEFKQGLFEIQDEGSQMIAALVRPKIGDQILDYCSGSGGKTLAIAAGMAGRGQIYLHDIRPGVLHEARRRCRRAGVQNAQFLHPGHPRLHSLTSRMDWVLADVPCSGSGVYRRNPDMKWKVNDAMLGRLIEEQREIFTRALSYARPGGRIVYATCSLFQSENERQAEFFLKNLPVELSEPYLSILPAPNGPDGFFGAVFTRKF